MKAKTIYWIIGVVVVLVVIGSFLPKENYNYHPEQITDSDMSAIEMMEVAFIGEHSQEEIKTLLDETMELYSLPINEENYQRFGSVLVSLRKETGVSEMEIVTCMKAADYKNTIGEEMAPEEAIVDSASICAATLSVY